MIVANKLRAIAHPNLTVKDLAKLLSELSPEQQGMPVFLEGCDCGGYCIGATLHEDEVTLRRDDGTFSYDNEDILTQHD